MGVDTFADEFLRYLRNRGPECPFQVMIENNDALDIDRHGDYETVVGGLIARNLIEPARGTDGDFGILYARFRLS